MSFASDGPMAIPLWIAGHAYLTAGQDFYDVADPQTGRAVRRVPLCGADEAAEAVRAARAAQPDWAALAPEARRQHLSALADALDGYAGHFAKLVRQETGKSEDEAAAEVAEAVAALRAADAGGQAEYPVFALVADNARPLAALAAALAARVAAGAAVVAKPSPRAPSAAFALCELTARTGWPGGVVNLVHGDEAAIAGLCAAGIDALVYAGAAELGAKVAAVAARHGRPCIAEGA